MKESFNMTKSKSRERLVSTSEANIILFTMIGAFLAGCAVQEANTHNPTLIPPEGNISPTVETTVIPRPTATVEATQSPAEIARGFAGLDQERLYTVEGDYLVDQYNKVPKAVLNEDGSWRKLDYANPEDAATMYANLVPVREEYINKELLTVRGGGRTLAKMHQIKARYLGDWEVEKVYYDGQEMDLYTILTGLRDGNGNLHIVRVPMDIPAYGQEHGVVYICDVEGLGVADMHTVTLFRLIRQLSAGEKVGLEVYSDDTVVVPEYTPAPKEWYSTGSNIQSMIINKLFNEYDDWKLTPEEKQALDKGEWPNRVVTLGQPQRQETISYPTGPTFYRKGSGLDACLNPF
jgi:hypothetical protein